VVALALVCALGGPAACPAGDGVADVDPVGAVAPAAALPGRDGPAVDEAARWAAAAARPAPLRSAHRRPDGGPLFVNAMIFEESPYLRQHAHLPVDWRPWGEQAWAEARASRKLVLVSVGYATCHWCHVMEAESWDDLEVAALVNRGFVAVKVDRQERPGVDRWALHLLAGLGAPAGWPAHLVLSPEGEPLWGGAYLPARDGDRGPGSVGLITVLRGLAAEGAVPEKRARGAALVDAVEEGLRPPAPLAEVDGPALRAEALGRVRAEEDPVAGGRRGARRFPAGLAPALLVAEARRGEAWAAAALRRSVAAWTRGGLMDPLAGGFHRYTVDAWQTPHFEKMLLENVVLGDILLDVIAAGLSEDGEAEAALRGVLALLQGPLLLPSGCFGAGLDADSGAGGAGEGAAYTWTPAELAAAAAPDPSPGWALGATLGDRQVLNGALLLDPAQAPLRARLLAARARRPQPALDPAELVLPNALAVQLLVEAGLALGEPQAVAAGARCGARLLADPGPGPHSRVGEVAVGRADLGDSAALVLAALSLGAAAGDGAAIDAALARWRAADARFGLPGGGWRSDDQPWGPGARLAEVAEPRDGDAPSAHSLMVAATAALADWTGDPALTARAGAGARAAGEALLRRPDRHPWLLSTLADLEDGPLTVVIAEAEGDAAGAAALLSAAHRHAVPGQRTARARPGAGAVGPDRLQGKGPVDGRSAAYPCVGDRCLAPVVEAAALPAALRAADAARRRPR
jgi:uncharacterized protein YyaL (SSP411 family)